MHLKYKISNFIQVFIYKRLRVRRTKKKKREKEGKLLYETMYTSYKSGGAEVSWCLLRKSGSKVRNKDGNEKLSPWQLNMMCCFRGLDPPRN